MLVANAETLRLGIVKVAEPQVSVLSELVSIGHLRGEVENVHTLVNSVGLLWGERVLFLEMDRLWLTRSNDGQGFVVRWLWKSLRDYPSRELKSNSGPGLYLLGRTSTSIFYRDIDFRNAPGRDNGRLICVSTSSKPRAVGVFIRFTGQAELPRGNEDIRDGSDYVYCENPHGCNRSPFLPPLPACVFSSACACFFGGL